MYKCDVFWQEIETNTDPSVLCCFKQILAQWAHVFTVAISFVTFLQNYEKPHLVCQSVPLRWIWCSWNALSLWFHYLNSNLLTCNGRKCMVWKNLQKALTKSTLPPEGHRKRKSLWGTVGRNGFSRGTTGNLAAYRCPNILKIRLLPRPLGFITIFNICVCCDPLRCQNSFFNGGEESGKDSTFTTLTVIPPESLESSWLQLWQNKTC